jgi:hypothetical protein
METSMSLFQISQDLIELFNIIEENEGELTPEAESALVLKEEQLNEKGMNYRKAVVYLEGQAKLVKEEITRLKVLEKKFTTNSNNLKKGLLQAVLNFGEQDKPTKAQEKSGVEGTRRLTVRDFGNIVNLSNRQTVVCNITDIDALSSEFINVTFPKINKQDLDFSLEHGDISMFKELLKEASITVDKSALTKSLKLGMEIEGAELEVSHSLTIK